MKQNVFAILKALGITAGLNTALAAMLWGLTPFLNREDFYTFLLLGSITLLLLVGVCLFAAIPTENRSILWGCYGIAAILHLILATGTAVLLRKRPPYTGDALRSTWLLLLLLILTAWLLPTLAVTLSRAAHVGRALREEKRQQKRARKGYRREYLPVSPARARLYASCKGLVWVLWLHILTGLLFCLFDALHVENSALPVIAYPVLWCLMAAVYGLHDRPEHAAFTLSASVSHLTLFVLSCGFCMLAGSLRGSHRLRSYLTAFLARPDFFPEQLLTIGLFLSAWVPVVVFAVAHRNKAEK